MVQYQVTELTRSDFKLFSLAASSSTMCVYKHALWQYLLRPQNVRGFVYSKLCGQVAGGRGLLSQLLLIFSIYTNFLPTWWLVTLCDM